MWTVRRSPQRRLPRSPGAAARFGQANYEAVGADGKPMTFADAKDLQLHNTLMATRAGARASCSR
jgi:hypothetical protein